MADTTVTTALEPDGAPRLAVLDIMRGVAILGILFMNINDMGGPLFLMFGGDQRMLGWAAADQAAWWLREVLANGTARCMLEMLFGVGMVILTDRAATRLDDWHVLRGYAWRNLVLFAVGLIHVFVLLWPGDILHSYGLAALIAVLFRRMPPRLLLTLGLVSATVQLGFGNYAASSSIQQRAAVAALHGKERGGQALTARERKQVAALDKRLAESAKNRADIGRRIAAENVARSGAAGSWGRSARGAFLYIQAQFFELFALWEAAGTMLIGAALYQWGIIQGQRSRGFYGRTAVVAYAIGLGLRVWGAYAITRFDHMPSMAYAFGEYARLATTLGHVALINLAVTSVTGARLLKPFEAAGRTALTLYIVQTIICLWVLYPPWGLALYGRQGWAALMLTALVVDAGLLLLAGWWVRRFAIAPVEWAWRSIVAGRALPFRLRPPAAAIGRACP